MNLRRDGRVRFYRLRTRAFRAMSIVVPHEEHDGGTEEDQSGDD